MQAGERRNPEPFDEENARESARRAHYNHAMVRTGEKKEILERAEKERVKFLRLQFTDILGVIKNVEVPNRQFS